MDVIIEERGKQFDEEVERIRARIEALAAERLSPEERAALLVLMERLLGYSHSQILLKQPPEQLLVWLREFLEFLSQRDELVKVTRFSPKQYDHSFLLINTPDVAFLVDTLQMLFQRKQIRAIILSHPVLTVQRDAGTLSSIKKVDPDGIQESFMVVQIDREQPEIDTLLADIREIISDAQQVGRLRSFMQQKLSTLEPLAANQDQRDFLKWLQDFNFICFAYARIRVTESGGQAKACLIEGPYGWSPRGLFTDFGSGNRAVKIPEEHQERLSRRRDFVVEVLDQPSLLHRDEPLVYLGFRERQDDSHWIEHAFVGMFSQNSINELTFNIAPLKDKVQSALERQHVMRHSYDYRKVIEIFNTFPKVELFFMDEREMDHLVRSFVALQRYQAVKVVVTRSLSLRGITLLMIMPRDFYGGATIRRLEAYLRRYFKSERIDTRVIHFYSQYLSLHVRVVPHMTRLKVDIDRLEKKLTDLSRPWGERLRHLLVRHHGPVEGVALWRKYLPGLPHEYKALIHPRYAIRDVRAMEQILADGRDSFELWGPFQERRREIFRLQFYSLQESCLNELMPFLENLNLTVVDEVDFNVEMDEATVYIKSFAIRNDHPAAKPLSEQRSNLLQILNGLREGTIEDDYLNRIMVLTGLDWQQIDVFRAYRNYYFQLGNPFTKRRVAFALINNPQAAMLLYRYFEARFLPKPEWEDPLQREEEALMPIRLELAEVLDQVKDINEDRILRNLFNLIDSTVRTNFFLRRDEPDYYLSFKISAIGIIDMPFPRPLYETYVHSAAMEGIHLRGGRVARGGIRWSDRPDDFRTEVLGLLKTQMTKNALIVPVGSKGGFIVKRPYTTREEGAELSRQAYVTLMRGLLDLVDNRVGGDIKRPPGVVVYDDLDPYLVVAADKGTAHLPDTANGVSAEYGFWLGDAFASGGSVGYDHKKLGITARGGWECVKRHFRELGKDIQNEDFTVIGIGDMSGDVFGNGMLLSRRTCLLAAFNHMHIFIDPNPDPEISWTERKRLFDLPRSTWTDYNPELISSGGGVWPRSAKDIPLSPEIRRWLGVRHASMEGEELIRRILAADAELLWNGGIGTYVKSSEEKHADVGDRTNDNVRVHAGQLKVRVIGEGGNLGLTQKARIEYALEGGRVNTDSIDNSAGVDISDHEVNLKIFVQTLRDRGLVKRDSTRNKLLFDIEDDVCRMVLHNNYTQSLCLSLDSIRCSKDTAPFVDLADRLANAGLLDQQSEFLPSRKELAARDAGYVRPELAILLSYSKMHLFQALVESDLPDREPVQSFLSHYFPELIRNKYGTKLGEHPLRREIIATMITNRVIDQAGCSFLNSLSLQTGATLVQGVAAYLVFDEILQGVSIRAQVFDADNRLPANRQHELLLALETTLAGLCLQVIEQGLPMSLDQECVNDYRSRLQTFRAHLKELLTDEEWQTCQQNIDLFVSEGFDRETGQQMASFHHLVGFLPAVHIAEKTGAELFAVSEVMSMLRRRLNFTLINTSLQELMTHDRWDRMAQSGLRSSLIRQFVRLTEAIVSSGSTVDGYLSERRQRLDYYLGVIESIRSKPPTSTSPFMVLLRSLEALAD